MLKAELDTGLILTQYWTFTFQKRREIRSTINPLAPELLFFLILAHPVHKMWIIQEPNKLALWNKLHFEEKKKTESIEHV